MLADDGGYIFAGQQAGLAGGRLRQSGYVHVGVQGQQAGTFGVQGGAPGNQFAAVQECAQVRHVSSSQGVGIRGVRPQANPIHE